MRFHQQSNAAHLIEHHSQPCSTAAIPFLANCALIFQLREEATAPHFMEDIVTRYHFQPYLQMPTREQQNVVLVNTATVREAETAD